MSSALSFLQQNSSDKVLMDSVVDSYFKDIGRSLSLHDIFFIKRVWSLYYESKYCRCIRVAVVLNLPLEKVEGAFELMDRILIGSKVFPCSGTEIDLEVVARVRGAIEKHNNENETKICPLVDVVLHTDRTTCLKCSGQLQWHPSVEHRKAERVEKQDMTTNRSARSPTIINCDIRSTQLGPAPLTCKMFKKYCVKCGLEHDVDRALERSNWSVDSEKALICQNDANVDTVLCADVENDVPPIDNSSGGGRSRITKAFLYPDSFGCSIRQVTHDTFITRGTLRAIDAMIMHGKTPFTAMEKYFEQNAAEYDFGAMSELPQGAGRFSYRKLETAFLLEGFIQAQTIVHGTEDLSNIDLGVALQSEAKFYEYLVPATDHDTGILAKAVRLSGMDHAKSKNHSSMSEMCDHACHLVGLVNDGNTDLDRSRCLLCPKTPCRSCDYCVEHCASCLTIPKANEHEGKECLVRMPVHVTTTSSSHARPTIRYTRVPGIIGRKITAAGSDHDGGLDVDSTRELWLVNLKDKSGKVTSTTKLSAYELRDAITAKDNNQAYADEEELATSVARLRVALSQEEAKSGGMILACLPKGLLRSRRNVRTFGWQAYVDLEGNIWNLRENDMHAEGSRHILQSYVTMVKQAHERKIDWPLRDPQDSGCTQIRTRFVCLIETLKQEPDRNYQQFSNSEVWILIVLVIVDIYIDQFHFVNHSPGDFCGKMMNPEDRLKYLREKFPGYNDQVCEQLWAIAVNFCKSVTYMSIGTHRAFLHILAIKLNLYRRDRALCSKTRGPLNRAAAFETTANNTSTPHSRAKAKQIKLEQEKLIKIAADTAPPKQHAQESKSERKVSWATGSARWEVPDHCSRPFPPAYENIRALPLSFFKENLREYLRFFRCFILAPWDQLTADVRFIARQQLQDWVVTCFEHNWCAQGPTKHFVDAVEEGEAACIFNNSEHSRDALRKKYAGLSLYIKRKEGSTLISEHLRISNIVWAQSREQFDASITSLRTKRRIEEPWSPQNLLTCTFVHSGLGDERAVVPNSTRYISVAEQGYAPLFQVIQYSPYNGNIAFKSDLEKTFLPFLSVQETSSHPP
uniref:Uncharacterized protein n=1 Tax=Aureoumbra lagunensis TaxID=44058 RepID=A0A7S3JTZ9_9STRA|mmetsp:Transcript_24211/g.29113  ORF Transcript_24211/g.29113 Transcript_24211/m.29113 type:complete len:1083 (-) Transcript_24211:169-3417(-)